MRTAVVICPGRGTYNATELGYLARNFSDKALLAQLDGLRDDAGQKTLTALDGAARFSAREHGRGDNASALIYAATLGDFLALDRKRIEIVAVTGNSMGWYSALACAGALSHTDGFDVANTMGTLMQQSLIGGQSVHPFVGNDWSAAPESRQALLELVADIDRRADHSLALSIDLGGMIVLGGNQAGLAAFESSVEPVGDRFPMRLTNHAAFHTAMQEPVAAEGRTRLHADRFVQPTLPMIDGRGGIWWPHSTDTHELWDYTLGTQVTQAYDFTRAITVAAREFAPDLFIMTGPGTTLGGAVIQSLIMASWRGLSSKAGFDALQSRSPLLLSMGRDDQRTLATKELS